MHPIEKIHNAICALALELNGVGSREILELSYDELRELFSFYNSQQLLVGPSKEVMQISQNLIAEHEDALPGLEKNEQDEWRSKACETLRSFEMIVKKLESDLIEQSFRLAQEKLRADQMTEQHKMQSRMHSMSNNAVLAMQDAISSFRSVINYALGAGYWNEPLEFLRCWQHGNFEALRKEWPDAPQEIYFADPLAPATPETTKMIVPT